MGIRFGTTLVLGVYLSACSSNTASDGPPNTSAGSLSGVESVSVLTNKFDVSTEGYVHVPGGGFTHSSCGHRVPTGASVGSDLVVRTLPVYANHFA